MAARPLGLAVSALHVHHGLNAEADDWLHHCAAQCNAWSAQGHAVRFEAERLADDRVAGESVEAWARRGRYRALRRMAAAHGADVVLLGHHRRDQAETFLLQALRGAGPAGLAAMPRSIRREGITWARPWLDRTESEIAGYARAHDLRWIEDSSNADTRFARNRLRHGVWPALQAGFPQAALSLAAAARWAAEASAVNREVAAEDLARIADAEGLRLDVWRGLSQARRRNALRAWIHAASGTPAPATLLERMSLEADVEGRHEWPVAGGWLRSDRGVLRWSSRVAEAISASGRLIDARDEGRYAVSDWHGALVVSVAREGGIAIDLAGALELRARAPGDRFQAALNRPRRSLKLQYQAAGIPVEQREGPLFCAHGRLVFVPGLGIDAQARAPIGEPQVSLAWLRDPA